MSSSFGSIIKLLFHGLGKAFEALNGFRPYTASLEFDPNALSVLIEQQRLFIVSRDTDIIECVKFLQAIHKLLQIEAHEVVRHQIFESHSVRGV